MPKTSFMTNGQASSSNHEDKVCGGGGACECVFVCVRVCVLVYVCVFVRACVFTGARLSELFLCRSVACSAQMISLSTILY